MSPEPNCVKSTVVTYLAHIFDKRDMGMEIVHLCFIKKIVIPFELCYLSLGFKRKNRPNLSVM